MEKEPVENIGEEEVNKKIIIDIGMGSNPFPVGRKKRKIKKDEIYIGIDPSENDIKNSLIVRDYPEEIGEGKGFILRAEGENLSFKKESVSEITIINLVGFRNYIDILDKIVNESKSVLKPDGKIYIVETNTPYEEPNEIINIFEKAGLKLKEYVKISDGEDSKNRITEYSSQLLLANDSYMLIFFKDRN